MAAKIGTMVVWDGLYHAIEDSFMVARKVAIWGCPVRTVWAGHGKRWRIIVGMKWECGDVNV